MSRMLPAMAGRSRDVIELMGQNGSSLSSGSLCSRSSNFSKSSPKPVSWGRATPRLRQAACERLRLRSGVGHGSRFTQIIE